MSNEEKALPDQAPPTPSGGDEKRALARRAGIVAGGTLVSRILGQVRESVMAAAFPAEMTDAFVVAFTIPNALRGLLAEGAVSGALVPTYAELRNERGEDGARTFYARFSGAMIVLLAITTVLGVLAAPALVYLYASGYADDPERFASTTRLTRYVFPYIFFMGVAALGMGALNLNKRFAVPALAPALLNVSQVLAPFVFVVPAIALGMPPVGALVIGALVGGVLQVVVQWPALKRVGMLVRPRFVPSDPSVREALARMVPLMFGLGVYQVNVMLSRQLASYLPEGSQSYLNYGQRLVEIPQGMFAVAIASAALPTLADLRARGKIDELKQTFTYALRSALFVALPATALLAALSEPIVTVLFGRGHFEHAQVVETAHSLTWQAMGVWAVAAVRVVVPMFHASKDTRTPVKASAANLVVFLIVGVALSGPLQHVGIAVAGAVAASVQFVLLVFLLRSSMGALGLRPVVTSGARTLSYSLLAAAAGWGVCQWGDWPRGGNDLGNIGVLVLGLLAAVAVFLVAAALTRAPELSELVDALRRRRRPRSA